MFPSILQTALAVTSIIPLVSGQSPVSMPDPTYTGLANTIIDVGCFSRSEPLTDQGYHQFQTSGICQEMCLQLGMPVMATVDGSNCWCGELLPPKDSQVDNSSCNTPCNGYGEDSCGGPSKWWVSLTAINKNHVEHYDGAAPSAVVSAAPQTTVPAVVTVGGSTVVMTVPGSEPTQTSKSEKSSGPNTAGIAAGVVVGVVLIAALVGGVWFFLMQRRRKAAEEEYKRNAAVNDFVAGGKPPGTSHSSLNDSRLDPEAMMHRRQSDGSIADNQDYSRRILRVANPDGY